MSRQGREQFVGRSSKRYVRSDGVLTRSTADRLLLLAPDQQEVIAVSGPGPLLWEILGRPASIAEAAEALASVYDAPTEEVAAAISPVIEQLRRHGGVETVGE